LQHDVGFVQHILQRRQGRVDELWHVDLFLLGRSGDGGRGGRFEDGGSEGDDPRGVGLLLLLLVLLRVPSGLLGLLVLLSATRIEVQPTRRFSSASSASTRSL
jgi:hypothetical protein